MIAQNPGYQIRTFPLSRRLILDAGAWGRRKHIIHLLGELDVTVARQKIRETAERTGEQLSFSAFITACVGRTVVLDRMWHAYRQGGRLILFDDVDVAVLVERNVEGEKLALFQVVRKSNEKSVRDIHNEIREAQRGKVDEMPSIGRWKMFLALPGLLRRPFYWWLDRSPNTRKALGGTVVVTAVGMFAGGAGWGIPISSATLTVTVGGVAKKPGFVNDNMEPREYLNVTVSFDHDIVDGAPAARFVAKLRELVENASLLT